MEMDSYSQWKFSHSLVNIFLYRKRSVWTDLSETLNLKKKKDAPGVSLNPDPKQIDIKSHLMDQDYSNSPGDLEILSECLCN